MPDNLGSVGSAAISIEADISNFRASLNKALPDLQRMVGDASSSVSKGFQSMRASADALAASAGKMGLALSAAVSLPLVGLASLGIGFDSMKAKAQVAFTNLLGSGEKAKAFLEELQDFASKTPFEFPQLVKASQRMISMGFAAKDTLPALRAIGDAAAGMGRGPEAIEQIVNALVQMKAKNKVSAEEMTQQLGEVVNAWQFVADAMGITVEEVQRRATAGLLNVDTTINAILAGMNTKFGGQMAAMSHQWDGLLSTIRDETRIILGSLFEGVFVKLQVGLELVVKQLPELKKWLASINPDIKNAVLAFAGILALAGPVALGVAGISAAFVFLTGPIGIATLAVGTFVAAMIAFPRFRGALSDTLRNVIGLVATLTVGLSEAAKGLFQLAMGRWLQAWDTLSKAGPKAIDAMVSSLDKYDGAIDTAINFGSNLQKSIGDVQAALQKGAVIPTVTGTGGAGLSEELKKIRDGFLAAEQPANALNVEFDALIKSGVSLSRILAVYSAEIVTASDAQLAHGVALSGTIARIAEEAFNIERLKNVQRIASDSMKAHPLKVTTAPLVESNQAILDEEIRKSSLEAKDRFEQAQSDGTFTFPLVFQIDPNVVFKNPIMMTAGNAIVDIEAMRREAMGLEDALEELRGIGLSDAQIMAVLDSVIKSATKNAALFGITLGPMTAELVAMQKAAEANAEAAKRWQQVWAQAVAQTVSSFSQAFTDLVFGFGRVTDSINAAKDALASLQQQLDRRKADFSASLESDAIETELEDAQKAYDASQRVGKLLPTVTSGGTAGDARADAALDVLRAKQLRDSETAQTIAAYNRLRDAKAAKDAFEKRERARAIAQERADIATLEREVKAAADRVLTHLGAFASAVKGIFAQLGKSILEIMVTGVFTQIASGLSKILTDFAGQNTGILGSIAGGLAKVFGAGKGASAAGTAAGAAGTAAGAAGAGAGAGAGAASAGGAGGGAGSSIAAFASNPITIAVAGAIATALIVKHFVGQGRRAANEFVQGAQDPFTGSVDDLAAIFERQKKAGTLTVEGAQKARDAMQALYTSYKATGEDFARQGSDQAKVWNQAKQTLAANYGPGLSKVFDAMESTIATLKAEGKTDASIKPGGVGIPETGLANSASRLFSDAVTRLIKGMDAIVKSIVPAPAVVVQQAASGGFVRKGGLVQLHAGEVIQPPAQLNPMYLLRSFIPRLPDMTRGMQTGIPAMASASGGNVSMPITQNLTFNLNGHELNRATVRNVILPEVVSAMETGIHSYRERLSKIFKPHMSPHAPKTYESHGS